MQEQITSEVKKGLPTFQERSDFISIGNFKHAPNADAVQYLKKDIWPLIHKKLPEAKMLIYGAYPTPAIQQLHEPKMNFLVKGRAESAGEVVKAARVSLAALRYGAGLKGKITEAIQCGTPVVTTETGAEGMLTQNENKLTIASTPAEFAENAISLYTSKKKWSIAAENGFELINRLFGKQYFHDTLTARINNTKENLQEHRSVNFTGSMLKHHYSRSTYYLSKYIELKNELEKIKGK
jgi:O-antigen biosynthesis protein